MTLKRRVIWQRCGGTRSLRWTQWLCFSPIGVCDQVPPVFVTPNSVPTCLDLASFSVTPPKPCASRFGVSLTKVRVFFEERTSSEKVSPLECPVEKSVVHLLDWWLMWQYHLWAGDHGCYRKTDWASHGSKWVISIPPWLLLQILPWYPSVMWKYKHNKPFLRQITFSRGVHPSNRNPKILFCWNRCSFSETFYLITQFLRNAHSSFWLHVWERWECSTEHAYENNEFQNLKGAVCEVTIE